MGINSSEKSQGGAANPADKEQRWLETDQARLSVVAQYAENILKYGRDCYRPDPSPLLADGINVVTKEHLKWVYPGGAEVVISNLACQQNFCRMMTALTNLTGAVKYKNAVGTAIEYYFDHYRDESGLLQWGGHRFVDLQTLRITGPGEKELVHELKNNFPDYDLMYEINPEATVKYIKAVWNAHVYNWETLETSRHGKYGLPMGRLWEHDFAPKAPFFETDGLTFLNTGNDLIYAAGKLYQYTGDQSALTWGKRLAEQYVRARHPQTKLGVYQFSRARKKAETNDANLTFAIYGDRARRQFGPEFGSIAWEGNVILTHHAKTLYAKNALIQLQLAKEIGEGAQEFCEWTSEGMAAYSKHAYIPATNQFRPLFTDGTDLSDYRLKRDGYYGRAGEHLKQFWAANDFLLSYARGFMVTGVWDLWELARGIAHANGLGDLGVAPGQGVKVNLQTDNQDPYALFAVLDIYSGAKHSDYLALARRIGNNIVKYRFVDGFFLSAPQQLYAKVDAIEPYALLALQAVIADQPEKVPVFLNGAGFVHGDYQYSDGTVRPLSSDYLFAQTRAED